MLPRCLLYYITDRTQFPGDEPGRCRALLAKISEATRAGVDYIQLREKDLPTCELEELAGKAVQIIRQLGTEIGDFKTRLLINSRTDIAIAAGADGVHLRSDDISAGDVRHIWAQALGRTSGGKACHPVIAVSCHSCADVLGAQSEGADFTVLAPVFEKPVFEKKDQPSSQPTGVGVLREACQAKIPVLALGGVTLDNANSCVQAGAAGIAAIRLFQENRIEDVVRLLRAL